MNNATQSTSVQFSVLPQTTIASTIDSASQQIRKVSNIVTVAGIYPIGNTAYQLCEELNLLHHHIKPLHYSIPNLLGFGEYEGLVRKYRKSPCKSALKAVKKAEQLSIQLEIALMMVADDDEKLCLRAVLTDAIRDVNDVADCMASLAPNLPGKKRKGTTEVQS